MSFGTFWHFWYIFWEGSFVEVGSVRVSLVIWHTFLVQLDECFQTRIIAWQCDLPFQSNEAKLFWDLALFGIFGTFFEKGHLSKWGQFEPVWWSDTLFWYSFLHSINFVDGLCECDFSFRSSDHKLSWAHSQTFMGLLTNLSSYEVSSNEPQDLTHVFGTVCCALSNG